MLGIAGSFTTNIPSAPDRLDDIEHAWVEVGWRVAHRTGTRITMQHPEQDALSPKLDTTKIAATAIVTVEGDSVRAELQRRWTTGGIYQRRFKQACKRMAELA